MTQEEIDLAAKEDFQKQKTYDNSFDRIKGFKAGVKFAQSKMYSEKEVADLLATYERESKNHFRLTARDWFAIKKKK